MKYFTNVFVVAFVSSTAFTQSAIPKDFQNNVIRQQKLIISGLSGANKLPSNTFLKQRWTKKEKTLARNYLSSKLKDIGLSAREHNYNVTLPNKRKSLNPFVGTNLFAIVPATEPSDQYIIVGAHYDSVEESPGAMDNATGCALVYGVAKCFSNLSNRKKNLLIVFFDQEETGHAGSFAFANYLKVKNFNIHSVHTADMIGWDKDKDRNIEVELPSPDLESIYKKHAKLFGIVAHVTETSETDHREFRAAGFNAVGIGGEFKQGDTSPHHHLATDTVETVDFGFLAFVTHLVCSVIEELMTD